MTRNYELQAHGREVYRTPYWGKEKIITYQKWVLEQCGVKVAGTQLPKALTGCQFV